MAALFGLLTAFVGTLLDQTMHWHKADGIASIVIGGALAGVAVLLVTESKALLVGEGADLKTLRAIRELTERDPGVELAGYPLTMYFGPRSILLAMNIRFAPSLSRNTIQESIDRIEAAVRQQFPRITYIYLEAEAIRSSPRLSDPDYPSERDKLPSLQ